MITNKQLTFMKMSQNINTGHYFKKTYAVFLFSYFSPSNIQAFYNEDLLLLKSGENIDLLKRKKKEDDNYC